MSFNLQHMRIGSLYVDLRWIELTSILDRKLKKGNQGNLLSRCRVAGNQIFVTSFTRHAPHSSVTAHINRSGSHTRQKGLGYLAKKTVCELRVRFRRYKLLKPVMSVSGAKSDLNEVITKMERALTSLDIWFRANGLKLNAEKTQLMLLGSAQNLRNAPNVTVKFRDHTLSPVSEARNLGIVFDRNLNWNAHVSSVTRRCFGILSGLSHLKGRLPSSVISVLVSALVVSQVRYCISIYGSGSKKNLARIQKILNYGAKIIFGRKKYDHVSDLLDKLSWLSAESMVSYHTLCMVHKVRRLGEPHDLAAGFSTVAEVREARGRSQDNPTGPRPECAPVAHRDGEEALHLPRSTPVQRAPTRPVGATRAAVPPPPEATPVGPARRS